MAQRFNVLFRGEVLPGQDPDTVKLKLAELYKVPVVKIEPWFSGGTVTIKKDLDQATAENYRQVFEKAGARCIIEPESVAGEQEQRELNDTMPEPSTDNSETGQPHAKSGPKRRTSASTAGAKPGFLGSLFDFSFRQFVTPRIITFLFILAIIGSAIGALMIFFGGLRIINYAPIRGIVMLILSPLAFFLYVLFARLWLELVIVVFRIAENTSRLVERDHDSYL